MPQEAKAIEDAVTKVLDSKDIGGMDLLTLYVKSMYESEPLH